MVHKVWMWRVTVCCGLAVCLAGCPTPPDESTPPSSGDGSAVPAGEAPAADGAETGAEEVLLQPFDPPPLAELEASVEWKDQPVLDSMELLREFKADNPPPLSDAEALALRNDSPANNELIVGSLGRTPSSAGEVDYEARVDRSTNFDLKSTNPLMISSTAEFDYAGLTGFGLFTFDWTFRMFAVKDTVVSWQTSSDGLYDKVVLRDDLVWSDGTPITAQDVEFSFQTIMNPRVPIPAVRSGTDQLKWVAAYDDRTVVFFHKESLATNIFNVAFPIIPRHIYEKSLADDPTLQNSDYHVKLERAPVVGGPYRLKRRSIGQEFVLERRDDWYMKDGKQIREKPYFQEIRFRVLEDPNTSLLAIKNGDIHDIEFNPEQWVTQSSDDDYYRLNTKASGVEWAFAYISWNMKNPMFSDKRVRQAMSYALDHQEMLDKICYGLYEPCRGIFHETAWMAPKPMPEPYHQDLDKAEELLDAAGWTDSDGDGIRDKEIDGQRGRLEFSLIFGEGTKTGERIATLFQENLQQIGVLCTPKPTEFTVMQQLARNHEFQAMMAGWGTGIDPESGENLWTTKVLKGGRNYSYYSNPEVDRLFEEGKREFDREKRAAIYAKIHMILWEDQPYTWLYYRNSFYGFNKRLRGYMFCPKGPYNYGPGFSSLWMPAMP